MTSSLAPPNDAAGRAAQNDGVIHDAAVAEIRADSIARGVTLMLALTVVQRSIGFARNVAICRFLDPSELGVWNLAHSFLLMGAPLIILGIPGSYVRYVEFFRQRNQLRGFLKKTLSATFGVGAIGIFGLCVFRHQVSWFVFGSEFDRELFLYTVATLLMVVTYNCGIELLTALRQVRANSILQFVNSVLFTLFSVSLLVFTTLGAKAVLVSYLLACLVTTAGAVYLVKTSLRPLPAKEPAVQSSTVWRKIGPFIGWFWLADMLCNLFGWVDRLMIVHYSGLSHEEATALVGQYHSSRIIGILLIAVTCMVGNVLLSYLSYDWESNRKEAAAARLDFALRLCGIAITLAAIGALFFAPFVFDSILNGAYTKGLSVLPLTLSYCLWYGLFIVVGKYIWCHEKPWLVCTTVFLGIATNAILNAVLLPRWGLAGTVVATAIANLTMLFFTCEFCRQLGLRFRRGTIVAMVLPAVLALGSLPALAISIALIWHGTTNRWLFNSDELNEIRAHLLSYLTRLPGVGRHFANGLS